MKNKLLILVLTLIMTYFITGCKSDFFTSPEIQHEYYNNNDRRDFGEDYASLKFEVIQFNQVLDEKILNESKLDGTMFLLFGSIEATSNDVTTYINKYFMYVKNKNSGIYYAEIPADRVRVYQDATEGIFLVGKGVSYKRHISIDVEKYFDIKGTYSEYNLHIPNGTIIPNVGKININTLK